VGGIGVGVGSGVGEGVGDVVGSAGVCVAAGVFWTVSFIPPGLSFF